MKRFYWLTGCAFLSVFSFHAAAQSVEAEKGRTHPFFDFSASFEELNAVIDTPGVTVTTETSEEAWDKVWAKAYESGGIAPIPDFGIGVYDGQGQLIELFTGNTPYQIEGEEIFVPGYTLPPGGTFETMGREGVKEAFAKLEPAEPPGGDIQKAVDTISRATDYIASELCSKPSRPTKLVLNLTAGFRLALTVETGSQVEWDLEIVCNRI